MKKNLLFCFIFLFTTVFYAQVSDIVHCSEDYHFDLTTKKAELIGNLDPAKTTVSYHLSLADATNNTAAIANPSNYSTAVSSTPIYARIDNNGSITTNFFNVKIIPALNITATNKPILCQGQTASLSINVSGGSGSYLYSINGSSFTSDNYYPYLPAGIYKIQVQDVVTACITTINYTITEPAKLIAVWQTENQNTIIPTNGGTAPYQYSLNGIDFQASNFFPNLAPGFYQIRVRDDQGCPVLVTGTIVPPLTCTAVLTKEMDCTSNAEIAISAAGGKGPYQYSRDGGITFQTSNIFNNLNNGTYTIAVKDTQSTVNYTNAIIIAPPKAVVATVTITKAAKCGENDTATIMATEGKAPFQYSFDGSNTFSAVNTAGLTPGIHTIFVRDANNCFVVFPVSIEPLSSLSASFVAINPICSQGRDGKIVINAEGGTKPYTYSVGNGYFSSNVFNGLSAGYHNISVIDSIGCIYTMVATIVEPAPLSITASTTNSSTIADNDGTITVNAIGGVAPYSYGITDNFGLPVTSFQTSNVFPGLKAGSYSVQVRDANGCIYSQPNITIANKPNSLVISVAVTPLTCVNPFGIITATATGGLVPYQYSWDNGATYVSTNVYISSTPGTYSVKVRDAENTITTITAVIDPVSPPTALIATLISSPLCNGGNNGSIEVNTIAGVAPYIYSLDNGPYINGNNRMTFANLYSGIHNITVQDANGCLATTDITVSEPVALITEATIKNQTITINVSGGTGTYKYAISPDLDKFIMNNVFSELMPDSYTVHISDENGCFVTINAMVDPPAPTIDGQIYLTLPFKPGQTLANIIINGKNIKWYTNANPSSGKTSRTSETPLPLTTVIVDGTTYYASQTINGIESTERLAVTIKSDALGTEDFVIKDLTYYPNPVKNILTISNPSIIDEVILTSIKGERLLTKQINNIRSEIDLSTFSKGIYLLKIKSEGTEKTVKVIKE